MAKGKRSSGKNYTSKGERRNVARRWTKEARKEWMSSGGRMDAQINAFLKLKKVMLTIPNPDKNNTKERFIRVPAETVWKR